MTQPSLHIPTRQCCATTIMLPAHGALFALHGRTTTHQASYAVPTQVPVPLVLVLVLVLVQPHLVPPRHHRHVMKRLFCPQCPSALPDQMTSSSCPSLAKGHSARCFRSATR